MEKNQSGVSDCILWTGYICKKSGYGQVKLQGVTKYVHRLEWERFNGPIPEGLVVRHSCDVRHCRNIEHLSLGTYQDNSDDCTSRGRQARSDKLPQTKLSDEQVEQLIAATGRQVDIAKMFGVSQSLVSQLKSGRYARSVN